MKVTQILYLSEKEGCSPFSGAENHVVTLTTELARRGVDVELVALVWNAGPRISARLEELQREHVRVVVIERDALHTWKGRLWRAIECWVRLFFALRQRRDRIVHAHLDLIAIPVVARLTGCRTVYSIHNDEPFYRRLDWRLWLRIVDRWVVAYIAITEHVRRYYMVQAGIPSKKIATVRYGVKPFAAARLERRQYGIGDDCFVVGFVGRLAPQKNVGLLIEAMAHIPDAVAIIVGDGELRQVFERTVASRGLSNVRFLGAVEDAARLQPMFDVLCLPSRWEGLGLVLVEAMLQRVPIVASNAGAIPEVLGNGRYGLLFERDDVESLVRALRFAKNHPTRMRTLAARAHDRALADFSVGTMGERTERFYRQVLQ